MAAPSLIDGNHDGVFRFRELFNQVLDQCAADEWMIDEAEQHSIGARWKAAQRRLDGTQLSLVPFVVDDDFISFEVNGFCDGLRVCAKDNSPHANFAVRGDFQQMFEEWPSLVGK